MAIKESVAVLGGGALIALAAIAVGGSPESGPAPRQVAGPMQTGVTVTTTTPPSVLDTSYAAPAVKATPYK